MTRVFIADTSNEERFALQLLLRDLKLEVVGEAADWPTTLAQAPAAGTDMLLVDWDLLPGTASAALEGLRKACRPAMAIVLISRLDAREQAARASGADSFISKVETAERVADRFRAVASSIVESTTAEDADASDSTGEEEK